MVLQLYLRQQGADRMRKDLEVWGSSGAQSKVFSFAIEPLNELRSFIGYSKCIKKSIWITFMPHWLFRFFLIYLFIRCSLNTFIHEPIDVSIHWSVAHTECIHLFAWRIDWSYTYVYMYVYIWHVCCQFNTSVYKKYSSFIWWLILKDTWALTSSLYWQRKLGWTLDSQRKLVYSLYSQRIFIYSLYSWHLFCTTAAWPLSAKCLRISALKPLRSCVCGRNCIPVRMHIHFVNACMTLCVEI